MEDQYSSIFPERRVVYASFGQRLLAFIIDCIILILISIIAQALIGMTGYSNIHPLLDNLFSTAIGWLYAAPASSGAHQGTLGKRAMNIKVGNADGGRISLWQSTIRYFGSWVSAILILIGYFMMLWDKRNQTLHDKMAGSFVFGQDMVLTTPEDSSYVRQRLDLELVEDFKEKFAHLSDEMLRDKLADRNRYEPEAIAAAEWLLQERERGNQPAG